MPHKRVPISNRRGALMNSRIMWHWSYIKMNIIAISIIYYRTTLASMNKLLNYFLVLQINSELDYFTVSTEQNNDTFSDNR